MALTSDPIRPQRTANSPNRNFQTGIAGAVKRRGWFFFELSSVGAIPVISVSLVLTNCSSFSHRRAPTMVTCRRTSANCSTFTTSRVR